MPGLVPGIHVLVYLRRKDVDGRDIRDRFAFSPAMTKRMRQARYAVMLIFHSPSLESC